MIQRGEDLVIRLLQNVQQNTIKPIIKATVIPDSLIYTDEYGIYNALEEWGLDHQSFCHSAGEYGRDDNGDDFHEVHVNTIEGLWSLLRS